MILDCKLDFQEHLKLILNKEIKSLDTLWNNQKQISLNVFNYNVQIHPLIAPLSKKNCISLSTNSIIQEITLF